MTQFSILICDDEAELAEELGEFFNSRDWQVQVCVTGRDGIRRLQEGLAPTFLLTDMRMPDVDGAALIGSMRELPPKQQPLVVAVMTGHVSGQVAAAEFGADLLYSKPVDPFAVMEDLERLSAHPPRPAALELRNI